MSSRCIGGPPGALAPSASQYTTVPRRATSTTAPGSLPCAMSGSSAWRIRPSRSADTPAARRLAPRSARRLVPVMYEDSRRERMGNIKQVLGCIGNMEHVLGHARSPCVQRPRCQDGRGRARHPCNAAFCTSARESRVSRGGSVKDMAGADRQRARLRQESALRPGQRACVVGGPGARARCVTSRSATAGRRSWR